MYVLYSHENIDICVCPQTWLTNCVLIVSVFDVDRAEGKLMRMHTAVKLNNSIRQHSKQAELVIINFPGPPAKLSAEENCILLYVIEAQVVLTAHG